MENNKWAGYEDAASNKAFTYTLDEVGLPDFWIKVRNVSVYTPADLRQRFSEAQRQTATIIEKQNTEIEEFVKELDAKVAAGEMTPDARAAAIVDKEYSPVLIIDVAEMWMILEWNITGRDSTKVLATPSIDEGSDFSNLPIGLQRFIKALLVDALRRSSEVPKVTMTPSRGS